MTIKFRSDAAGGAILNENDREVIKIDANANVISGIAGQFSFFMLPAAPTGWIAGDGSTIGSAASGATRANADTQALFTAWWAYTDAQLPILTSAGGASTRGASAAADWAANKRLTVFDVRGRFPRAAGTINTLTFVNGTTYADTLKSHTHSWGLNSLNSPGAGAGAPGFGTTDGTTSATGAAETAPVSLAMLGCFKL